MEPNIPWVVVIFSPGLIEIEGVEFLVSTRQASWQDRNARFAANFLIL
jgi:hypothetical protein